MEFVSEEILIEILTRLPVKSLVRFMVVCRLWKSIITSPQFIRLQSAKRRRTTKLLVHTDQQCHALVEDDDKDGGNLVLSDTTDFPFELWLHEAARVVGSDNGLVCIRIPDRNKAGEGGNPSRIIIWNPSIRKHAVVPMNPVGEPDYTYTDGFGATIISRGSDYDYKYVRIAGYFVSLRDDDDDDDDVDVAIQPAAVEIHSWKTGTWRRIDLDLELYLFGRKRFSHQSASLLRGRLHWTVRDPMSSSHIINSISAFDLEDEVFDDQDIMLPECFSSDMDFSYRANLFVVKESQLAMIVDEAPNCSVIWVMQQYGDVKSWTKLCRVDLTALLDVDWVLQEYPWIEKSDVHMHLNSMVHLLKNGDELLLGLMKVMTRHEMVHPPKLVKYNPKTSKATDIGGLPTSSSSAELRGFTNSYKESLVFLMHDHRVVADHKANGIVR